jgi:outer membrane protein assembly factor BamB
LGGTYPWSGLAYDAGSIFTVNSNGTLTAFNASTGVTGWSVSLPGQTSFTSPPTAINGYVYTGGSGFGGTLYAVSDASGQVVWTQPVDNGDESSPAVDAHGVFVTYACDQDYDFDPLLGSLIWHHAGPCSGGGGKTPVLANGHVLGRDAPSGNLLLSASAGSTQGSFTAGPAPAVDATNAYTVSGGTLTATGNSGLGSTAWTFGGDGHLDTAPLVVGNLVFEGSSAGGLYAVDASTGTSAWSTTLSSGVPAPDEQDVSQPLTGLGAGEGTLVVPTGSTLTAFTGANVGTGTPANSTAPGVIGTPVVGEPIGADVGTWSGLPTGYSYQWQECSRGTCSDIAGATGESYTPAISQIGDTLEVIVTATNSSGTSSPVVSASSAAVASPPINSGQPVLTGNPALGATLSTTTGTWGQSPTSYSYRWLRCKNASCTAINGATSSSYTVAAADIGSQLEAEVTAVNAAGATSVSSDPTAVIPTAATTISLTSSANPVAVGSPLSFTATISPQVDGGTMSFSQDGQPISWCQAMPVNTSSSSATCSGTAAIAGTDDISATYSGDGAFNPSTASLSESIVNASAPPPTTTSPGVALNGAPAATATSPTVYYRESGNVSSTVCTLDGQHVFCDTSHAALSHLSFGKHTFMVQVFGAGGSAHASVTWTVVAPPAKLPAPRNLRARPTRRGVSLSWSPVRGARSYTLAVTVAHRSRLYRLAGSARSYSLQLSRRRPASVRLCAVAANGKVGATARVSVR